MNNIFTLIIFLIFNLGFSQNSELIIMNGDNVLKSSDFDFFIKTKDDFLKFNDSNLLLYDSFKLENSEILSLLLISKKDTLNFNLDKKQKTTFEKENSHYKTLSISLNDNKDIASFDFEFCKRNNLDLIINISDNEFKKIFSEFMIGLENPNGKYDKELTSKYNIRQKNKKFRKRKKELKKYFKQTEFITLTFGTNIIY